MTEIPSEAFNDILIELERRPLPRNDYRAKAGSGRSQAFGLVNKRCMPVDYSRQCWKRAKLYYHILQFAEKYVTIPWTSITLNQNYQCQKHRDKGNEGNSFLVAFGNYQGGRLRVYEGEYEGLHDIRHKPIVTDFSKVYHDVEAFTGNRYSLVFYTLSKQPAEPLPPGKVVVEDGKYLFMRGDKVITEKEGIPHPLFKNKNRGVMSIESGDHSVSFE